MKTSTPRAAFLAAVMCEAWKHARAAAARTGLPVRSFIAEGLRQGWATMRGVAAAKAARQAQLGRQAALNVSLLTTDTYRPSHLARPLTRAGRGIPSVTRHTQGSRF